MKTNNIETKVNVKEKVNMSYCGKDGVRLFYKSVDGKVREYVWCIGKYWKKSHYEKEIEEITQYMETGKWKERKQSSHRYTTGWGLDGEKEYWNGAQGLYLTILSNIAKDVAYECKTNKEFAEEFLKQVDLKAKERDEEQTAQWKEESIDKNSYQMRNKVRGRKQRIRNCNWLDCYKLTEEYSKLAEEFELFEICGLEPYNGKIPKETILSSHPRWFLEMDELLEHNDDTYFWEHTNKRALRKKYVITYSSVDGVIREYVWSAYAEADDEESKKAIKDIVRLIGTGELTVQTDITASWRYVRDKNMKVLPSEVIKIFRNSIVSDIAYELGKECVNKEEFRQKIMSAADKVAKRKDEELSTFFESEKYPIACLRNYGRQQTKKLASAKRKITMMKKDNFYTGSEYGLGFFKKPYAEIIELCQLFEVTGIREYKEK